MVEPRRLRKAGLADDLQPQMQGWRAFRAMLRKPGSAKLPACLVVKKASRFTKSSIQNGFARNPGQGL
jgi:hypothetical protein